MKQVFLVAVTSCPSGVAHTYMAAEALERAAKKRNIRIKVETQSSMGSENEITQAEVDAADAVILTKDIKIDKSDRFNRKPVVTEYASKMIKHSDEIIDLALKAAATREGSSQV